MSSDLLADITAKRHGGTDTRLTNMAAEVAEGKRDIEGKSIVNPYQQRWAFDGWNMMIETVKSTACIPFVHGLYVPFCIWVYCFSRFLGHGGGTSLLHVASRGLQRT
jgi:hypothetical protein